MPATRFSRSPIRASCLCARSRISVCSGVASLLNSLSRAFLILEVSSPWLRHVSTVLRSTPSQSAVARTPVFRTDSCKTAIILKLCGSSTA